MCLYKFSQIIFSMYSSNIDASWFYLILCDKTRTLMQSFNMFRLFFIHFSFSCAPEQFLQSVHLEMRDRRTSSISQLFSKTLESINKSSGKSFSRSQNKNNLNNLSPVSSGYGSSTGSSKSLSCSTGKRVMLQQNSGRFIEEIKVKVE